MTLPAFTVAPLFDAHKLFSRLPAGVSMLEEYPQTLQYLQEMDASLPGAKSDFLQAQAFLRSYSRKSEATYRSYRNEVERLLLWTWSIAGKRITDLKRPDLERYFEFAHQPPETWVATAVHERFQLKAGLYEQNPEWRPFVATVSKERRKHAKDAGKDVAITRRGHTLSQEAMKVCYSAIGGFYDYLSSEGYTFGNPIPAIRKQSPFLLKGQTSSTTKRLSDLQWDFVLDTVKQAADDDPNQERSLFIIACLKTLYLRISELSERSQWQPVWEHFWHDDDGNHWLKVLGKGNKIRDVSVPDALLPYIERYRNYREQHDELFDGSAALVAKNRGTGGMTSRHLRRLVQDAFDAAYTNMMAEGFHNDAQSLREATTHWLRHTGASQDIATRPLKHMADDLGHASMGTTDRVYIQSDMKERARSGKKREV